MTFSKPIDPSEHVVREPISAAEFARFVQEAQEQRARADGYALLVKELRAALILDEGQYGFSCTVCCCSWDRDTPERHDEPICILAADPEARAAELLQELHKNPTSIVE